MDHREKVARLKRMLVQVAEDGIESMTPAAEGGLESMRNQVSAFARPESYHAHADSGLEKLKLGRESDINEDEALGLEAIIMPRERPVFFIDEGNYPALPNPWRELNDKTKRANLRKAIASIGRVELPTQQLLPYGGTGFIVGDGLLMTNRHVAKLFVSGVGVKQLLFTPGDATIDFRRERCTRPDDRSTNFEVADVVMVHPYWDMALLRVNGLEQYQPLSLSIVEPDEGSAIVAIGFPARDDRNDLLEQDRIFERLYSVKRFQPGRIRRRERIRSFEQVVDAITHDSSTLGGNSGSAIVDPVTGQVVALHFAGTYLKANYGVPAIELARDPRVVDAGVNFAGHLPSTGDCDAAWRRVGTTETVAVQRRPTSDHDSVSLFTDARIGDLTCTIPLRVTVSVGSLATQDAAVPIATAVTETMRIPIIYDGLEEREGFLAGFLGESVPLPELTERGAKAAATLKDGSFELKYHKFSVIMHKRRRLAIFTASNVDWRNDQRLINGKKPNRKQLTGLSEGEIEKWMTDWRIPDEHQLPDVFYTRDGGAFDKGHIVRRDDVAWGGDLKDMQMGNGDTYHTTNCSPQVSSFNQSSRGEDNWGDLENMVQKQTRAEKAVVLAGPVLAADDPLFDGKGDGGSSMVLRVPRRFWKIVVTRGENGLQAFGFVLEQDLSVVPTREELTVPPEWRRYMSSIGDIEQMLFGLAEFGSTKEWDQYHREDGEAIRQAL